MDLLLPSDAEKIIESHIVLLDSETVAFDQAYGRTLREPVLADRDFPPYDRVMMDGIAMNMASWKGEAMQSLGVQRAGVDAMDLREGAFCFEVMTGAVLPFGADTVVPIEQVTESGGSFSLVESNSPTEGQFVHRQGSDQKAGDLLLAEGTLLGGKEIAVLATCGYAEVSVSQIPRIIILSTGDELVEVNETPSPFQIRKSNVYALETACKNLGIPVSIRLDHLPDDQATIACRLANVLNESDLVLFSGGISKGKYDFLQELLVDAGATKHFQWVKQRPGKPLWFGTTKTGTVIFALPGNPNSTLTCFYRYVSDVTRTMAGLGKRIPESGQLAESVKFNPPLSLFLPVRSRRSPEGSLHFDPVATQNSGDLAGLIASDGFIELPAEQNEFSVGFSAPFYPW
ncbi:MAG: molybdopterin molybdenumtransferase MoeA [Opitutaceae bacterium]|nr:molybdopterin molybdenumtransferase MoeA [Opitutaceae bacterium]|tara:strand:+ start:3499 stop:4701 length:1203 start_codon:yes stop_codon:yes gene_type:complete